MWPWEHLAFGYLCVAVGAHLVWDDGPSEVSAVVAGVAALLPDLVDKPLAWWLGVLPSGRSFAHSLLVAVPVALLVVALARRRRATPVGVAFGVAYASHLAGDVLYPLVTKGQLRAAFLLWPVVTQDAGGTTAALPHLRELVAAFLGFLATPAGAVYLAADLLLFATALLLWALDGLPGLGLLWRTVTRRGAESPR